MDEVGRERLRNICQEFHQTCAKVNRERELETLHWRVQALAHGQNPESAPPTCDADSSTGCPANEGGSVAEAAHSANNVHTQKAAQLRVPMSKRACSWWRPEFWSIARPTDFCYGDCVWGFFDSQPVMLTIPEWIRMLFVTTRRRSTMTASRQLKDSSEASSNACSNTAARQFKDSSEDSSEASSNAAPSSNAGCYGCEKRPSTMSRRARTTRQLPSTGFEHHGMKSICSLLSGVSQRPRAVCTRS